MSKRPADETKSTSIGDLMKGCVNMKRSKRAQYEDSGDFSAAAGDEWGKNKDKDGGGGGGAM